MSDTISNSPQSYASRRLALARYQLSSKFSRTVFSWFSIWFALLAPTTCRVCSPFCIWGQQHRPRASCSELSWSRWSSNEIALSWLRSLPEPTWSLDWGLSNSLAGRNISIKHLKRASNQLAYQNEKWKREREKEQSGGEAKEGAKIDQEWSVILHLITISTNYWTAPTFPPIASLIFWNGKFEFC